MILTRWQEPETGWSPLKQMALLHNEVDRFFGNGDLGIPAAWQGATPGLDLFEDHEKLVLTADLPGMKRENIDIAVEGDLLTISGERRDSEDLKGAEIHRAERFLGKFQRTVALPAVVESGKIQAAYQNGVLTITLPKAEKAKPRKIEIKGS